MCGSMPIYRCESNGVASKTADERSWASVLQATHTLVPIGDYMVSLWLHTNEDPPKEQFANAIEEIAAKNLTALQLRNLVISDGGAPDTAQRKLLIERAWRKRPMKLAVVTTVLDNPLKRGVATALSWLNPNIHFFRPELFRDALAHIDLAPHAREVWDAYAKLQAQMKPIANLRMVGEAMGFPKSATL